MCERERKREKTRRRKYREKRRGDYGLLNPFLLFIFALSIEENEAVTREHKSK